MREREVDDRTRKRRPHPSESPFHESFEDSLSVFELSTDGSPYIFAIDTLLIIKPFTPPFTRTYPFASTRWPT